MSFWSHFQSLSSTRSKLAESSLWDQQTHFYQHHGIASWDNRVPYQITNSVRFASIYAEALLAFAQDSREQGYTGPIRVVELGASHHTRAGGNASWV